MRKSKIYLCPITSKELLLKNSELISNTKKYKILKKNNKHTIIDFINKSEKSNFYSEKKFYKNYLSWLSKTLIMNLESIRSEIFDGINIKKKSKILFVGCGFGDEIKYFIKKFKFFKKIYAQDISKNMIFESSKNLKDNKIEFSISNANGLPYKNDFFDLVFHFGGFNEFKKKKKVF
jgi:ubiquinone/menaquinone biosynthesis C-methylase UbiE